MLIDFCICEWVYRAAGEIRAKGLSSTWGVKEGPCAARPKLCPWILGQRGSGIQGLTEGRTVWSSDNVSCGPGRFHRRLYRLSRGMASADNQSCLGPER